MRLIIQSDYSKLSQWVADYVGEKILQFNPTSNRLFVLGLPTGSSPLGMYDCLIKLYQEKKISFRHVATFNMDEYVGLPLNHTESYHTFMWKNFFSHIDIISKNIHILNGNAQNFSMECASFEEAIKKVGGINIFLGGIGLNGHIAFNEPGSSFVSRTRITTLSQSTIHANSRFFNDDVNQVPKQALTVGIGTILDAKEILFMTDGDSKSPILAQAVEGSVSSMCPATFLRLHPRSIIVCDENAAIELKVGTYQFFKEKEKNEFLL